MQSVIYWSARVTFFVQWSLQFLALSTYTVEFAYTWIFERRSFKRMISNFVLFLRALPLVSSAFSPKNCHSGYDQLTIAP